MPQANLVGRQDEQTELNQVLNSVMTGQGAFVLLAGEAGVGKTRLAEECLRQNDVLVVKGAASETATPAYGPIITILRALLRTENKSILTGCDSLIRYLAPLLPELGPAPNESDQATLFEAIRCVIETVARRHPIALFLDDLQWADNATLELLPVLVEALRQAHVLILGAYRSDEIPRLHPMRRLRNELRRANLLHEIVIKPFNYEDTAQLAEQVLGKTVSPSLMTTLYNRTQGMPLFVEELATTLTENDLLMSRPAGLDLRPGKDIPIPDTLRDAVLLRLDGLSTEALKLIEIAAVAGLQFDLDLIINLAGNGRGLDELMNRSLIVQTKSGQAAFRHALTREAIYEDIVWTRCRTLHRQLAAYLEADKAPAELVAEHWLAGRETDKARQSLLVSARKSCDIHAYRDAAEAGRRALELWPDGEEEALRLDVLDQLGNCAQLCGMLAEAARAWREVAEGLLETKDRRRFAEIQRRLGMVYELQGAWGKVMSARESAAEAFAGCNFPGEAAAERLAITGHLLNVASFRPAQEVITVALEEAKQSGQQDLIARALGFKGHILAKLGEFEAGRETVQAGLELALAHNLTGAAAEIYWRLGTAFEMAADYAGSRDVYLTAINYCDTQGASAWGQLCMGCVAGVLLHTGEWQQAMSLCREVMNSNDVPPLVRTVSVAVLGLIHTHRGETKRARKLILEALTQVRWHEAVIMEIAFTYGLAMIDELEGDDASAIERFHEAFGLWQQTEERHFVVFLLRWAVTFFAKRRAEQETRACVKALAKIATSAGNAEALAALAHALGEAALLDNNPNLAAQQFGRALELLGQQEAPLQHAETELRSGVALVAAGQRETGVKHLVNAHRMARKLGARPLATRATQELINLDERIDERLSPRAARRHKHGGLTRRQLEVVHQLALGKTNPEIAKTLVLSLRTVDMHVGNILSRLDCRTRTEAVRKAHELGLLD